MFDLFDFDKTISEYSSVQKYINYNDFVKILNEAKIIIN